MISKYKELIQELNTILRCKSQSYARFAKFIGISVTDFYNNKNNCKYSQKELKDFIEKAKQMNKHSIPCCKCGQYFTPKAANVTQCFCPNCRKPKSENEYLKVPDIHWIKDIENDETKRIVIEENYINTPLAYLMAQAKSPETAKEIRNTYWENQEDYKLTRKELLNVR